MVRLRVATLLYLASLNAVTRKSAQRVKTGTESGSVGTAGGTAHQFWPPHQSNRCPGSARSEAGVFQYFDQAKFLYNALFGRLGRQIGSRGFRT